MSKKILVAYFSATGTTEEIARVMSSHLGADLYEIVPAKPYTHSDLNWNNPKSRSCHEMEHPEIRPEIALEPENYEDYDIVFIGYPIWWEKAPNIIFTFLESHDFSGKTVIPFSTSGGSIRGSKGTHLHAYCSDDVNWEDGKLLNRADLIPAWIKQLHID